MADGGQVARKWEQCDAEGVLLRAGAEDPEAGRPVGPAENGLSGAVARPEAGHGVQHRDAAAPGGGAGSRPARVQTCGSFSSVRAQAGSVGARSDDGAAPPAPGSADPASMLHALRSSGWLAGGGWPQWAPGLLPEHWGYAHWAGAACAVGAAAALAVKLTRSRSSLNGPR